MFVIPKIHKNINDPPFCSIIAAQGSITEPPSIFVDEVLKLYIKNFSPILKDSWDLLKKIEWFWWDEDLLVSMDVIDLFSWILKYEGLKYFEEAISEFNMHNNHLFICCEFLDTILSGNFFSFGREIYLQKSSVAMGATRTPTYANLVMAVWEYRFILSSGYRDNTAFYGRFLDDLIMFWKGDLNTPN